MKRGEIYYIEKGYNEVGSEQRTGRPAIIVSNDKCNEHSAVVEVVYLTTQPKSDLPTHIDIRSTPKTSVALCEQISSVSKERVGQYVGQCSEYEMLMLEAALEISLGIESHGVVSEKEPKVQTKEVVKTVEVPVPTPTEDYIKVVAERDTYKALYDSLFDRMVGGRA